MKPLLDVLIILDALEKEGSFAAASAKLFKTPSALSYTVHKLENDLNIQLLDRSGHRARFTRTGKMLLEKGREVLHTVRELEKQAIKLHEGWENELVIGVDDTFPFSLLAPLIDAFYQRHSVTRLKFVNGVLGGSWETLTQGRADIIVGAMRAPPPDTGFDGISNLSEETKDAERVIPRAIFLTALIGGLIFIFATYFLQLYFPDISRFKDPDASQPEIMLYVAGKTFQVGALIFSTITVLASGMAAHAGVARLMYVMGRDGVFPKSFFGYVHPKWRTPAMNIILVGAIALLAINFDLVMATALINFGALVAFTFVNLSVISQFWIREKRNKTLKDHFQYLFLPMCGALTVGALWVNLEESSMVLGLIWAGIGLIYLACVTKSFRNPVPQYEDVA